MHLAALLEPWPVIGSFTTSASAMPNTRRPEGSSSTGLRTIGVKRPERNPLASVSSTERQRSASQGA
ncbi:hypothetical protein D3C86_1861270 [compost metagenome]